MKDGKWKEKKWKGSGKGEDISHPQCPIRGEGITPFPFAAPPQRARVPIYGCPHVYRVHRACPCSPTLRRDDPHSLPPPSPLPVSTSMLDSSMARREKRDKGVYIRGGIYMCKCLNGMRIYKLKNRATDKPTRQAHPHVCRFYFTRVLTVRLFSIDFLCNDVQTEPDSAKDRVLAISINPLIPMIS